MPDRKAKHTGIDKPKLKRDKSQKNQHQARMNQIGPLDRGSFGLTGGLE